jgi:diacylglycerol kinase (ATP)
VRQERNIKVMLGGAAFAIVMGIVLRIGPTDWAVVAVCCGMVLAAELINTAIETVVDLVSPEFHPLAGRAKDIAAAASWLLSIAAAIAGLCVYGHALLELLAH